MKKKLLLIFTLIAQLTVPCLMIASAKNTLETGAVYKFKTAPIDPYDVMRGRFVYLSTDQNSAPRDQSVKLTRKQRIYLILDLDKDGFAVVTKVQAQKPDHSEYIKTKVQYVESEKIYYELPFNRYYMNERKALRAENLVREGQRKPEETYIQVRVKNGTALIEDLIVNQKPIASYFIE